MPLNNGYGVTVGTFASFTREDPTHYGSWYHGRLRTSTPAGTYEAALDVDTPGGIGVSYRLVRTSMSALGPLAHLPAGFTPLASNPSSGALDYDRSPFLRIVKPKRSSAWVRSNGNNALDGLEPALKAAAGIMVLGEPYTSGLGVHNVHQNQGDPPGAHQGEDGIWQDGAVVCNGPRGKATIWQVKFNTQSLRTDNQGLPLP